MNSTKLLAHINVTSVGLVYFFVTHLSYVKNTQCRNVVELISKINEKEHLDSDVPKILVGKASIFLMYYYYLFFFFVNKRANKFIRRL